jgi:hypothetical protein
MSVAGPSVLSRIFCCCYPGPRHPPDDGLKSTRDPLLLTAATRGKPTVSVAAAARDDSPDATDMLFRRGDGRPGTLGPSLSTPDVGLSSPSPLQLPGGNGSGGARGLDDFVAFRDDSIGGPSITSPTMGSVATPQQPRRKRNLTWAPRGYITPAAAVLPNGVVPRGVLRRVSAYGNPNDRYSPSPASQASSFGNGAGGNGGGGGLSSASFTSPVVPQFGGGHLTSPTLVPAASPIRDQASDGLSSPMIPPARTQRGNSIAPSYAMAHARTYRVGEPELLL